MSFESHEFAGNDRFRVIRQLGVGGMGMVYEAEDLEDGRRLAIKVIRHGNSEEIYRLKREFRALADLSHPNLVDVYDLGGEGHALFVTMELVHGETFTRHCRGDRQVGELGDERRIRAALVQLVSGLAALHEAGMVHRDVKPSNVLVTRAGRVVLLDLGLVATHTRADSMSGRIVGSVEYMAPEQAGAEAITPAADWYAVGSLLFEALTGKPPFSGSIIECLLAKQQHPAPPPRAIVPEVSEDLDDLCTALLAREPSRRPSLAQLLIRLGAAPTAAATPSLSVTQLVPFCGRASELERLGAAAARARAGGTAVVYVRGPSGIGKSALIDRFVDEVTLAEPPLLALRGRCYERETVPYKAMDAVIDELSRFWTQLPDDEAASLVPEHASLLPRLFPVLGRVPAVVAAPTGAWVTDPQEMRTRAFAALRNVFIELARRQPIVMVLDDLQWIDDDSVILLADLLSAPYPPGIMLLLASRDESDRSRARRARTETGLSRPGMLPTIELLLRGLPAHELIELGPLPAIEARRLAATMLGDNLAEHLDAVVGEAGGSPFFLSELSRYLQDGPDRERASIDDVLRARIARLPERGAAMLELLSIAGDPVSPRVVQSALGFAPEEVARLVRFLRASLMVRAPGGVNEAIEPYHDRLREHVRESLSDERRQQLHRDLAVALERWTEGSAEQRARHWFGAGDRERATRYAREAADEAVSTLDFARAARLYRLALDAGALDPAERRQVTTKLGVALSTAGHAAEGAAMLLEAAAGADPATALELRQRSAEALLLGGYIPEGMAALLEVLDQLGMRFARTPRTALLSTIRLRAWLRIRGLGWHRRDASEIPKTVLTEIDARYTVASMLSVVDNMRATEFQARHLLAALRAGEPERVARALGVEAGFYGALGQSARALRLADQSDRISSTIENNALPMPPFAGWARGAVEYFSNNAWATAREHFERTELHVRSNGRAGWELSTAQLYSAFALLYRGRIAELVSSVPQLLREAERRGDLYSTTNLRTRLNIVWLAEDDADRAEREIEDAMGRWVPQSEAFYVQHWFALVGRVELALYRGQPEVAARVLAETVPALRSSLLMRVPIVKVEVAYLEARAALARLAAGAEPAPELRVVRRCRTRLRRAGLPFGRQLDVLVGALAAVARGTPEADAALEGACRVLEAGDTMLYANAARRRLGVLRGTAGQALIEAADAAMRAELIRNPSAMSRMLLGVE